MITRRTSARMFGLALSAAALGGYPVAVSYAAERVVKIGINLSLTGADAGAAVRVLNGALLAFDDANDKREVPGVRIEVLTLDDATASTGQYDPAQAATNARKMVADKLLVAAIGPWNSGSGKAMAPILSQGELATITPASTNPDITDPKFASQYRPRGKPIYFRTVTTDAHQGPNLANFFADRLNIRTIYVLDDSGAYGVGTADAFQRQAEKKGIKVLGRDRLDPKAADYSAVLTKIKSLNPQAIYYGGNAQAGVKLAKQSYEIIPYVIKGDGDGMFSPDVLSGAGFPAVEGWYVTTASPHALEDPKAQDFVQRYRARFNMQPSDYAITAYDAAQVIIDAIKRVAASGKEITRSAVRDAIETADVPTLQGRVSFDENGDLKDRTVSVFQIKRDDNYPPDDMLHQYHYVGVAPES
jgi:branched-chain amino acid transport system substrate-binding protein